jgi:hypothetical protein
MAKDRTGSVLTLWCRQQLGVANLRQLLEKGGYIQRENDRRSDHRPGPAASPGLVDAGDQSMPLSHEGMLEVDSG